MSVTPAGNSTPALNFRGIVVRDESELFLVQSDAATVVAGSLKAR